MLEEQKSHSEIGASSYSRWSSIHGGCPGSVRLSRGLKTVESEYAKAGTHAHAVAAAWLEDYFYGKKIPDDLRPDDADMASAIHTYVEYCKARVLEANAPKEHIFIECGFDLSEIYPGAFGTADKVIYHAAKKKLIVIDYKNGAGIAVEIEDNLQLQYYGLGALLKLKLPVETVELVVVQPNCEHEDGAIRSWEFPAVEILDFAADLAHDAAEANKPDAPLVPSSKACRFCPAAATNCPAIKDKAQALAKIEFAPDQSGNYDKEKLDQALRFLPALEAWIKKVREFAYAEAMHGRTPPGWKMVAKRATRKWTATEEEIVKYMKEATLRDVKEFYTEPELKSPAQMEKLCSKQLNEGLRKMMVSVSSGYNLVPESDPRPAVKLDAKSEFTKIEGSADDSE